MKNLLLPKNFLAIVLLILLALTFFTFNPISTFSRAVVAVGTAVTVDFLFAILLTRTIFLPSAAIVSSLIIALLISPQAPFYVIIASAFFAIVGKNFGRMIFKQPLFNPAAAGLFIASLIFNEPLSWWGVSWGTVPLIITAVLVGYLIIFGMRRYLIPLPFLITYFVLNILISQSLSISSFLDPTVIFFSLVMLPEPTTSPNDLKRQVFYGIFVAIVVFVIGNFINGLPIDPLIVSLLLGNLVFKLI